MTRRHFNAIAKALYDSHASYETVIAMAVTLRQFNVNFDRQRFIDAAFNRATALDR